MQPRLNSAPPATARGGSEPVEIPVCRDVDENVDSVEANVYVVVGQQGAKGVQPPSEDESRHELPLFPVLQV